MEMPGPSEPHRRLEELAGIWIGEETMHPSPWTPTALQATSRIVAKMELGGFFLFSTYEQHCGGAKTFEGRGIYGWDAHAKLYTMHWFDTMGNDPGAPAMGPWKGQRLELENRNPFGHGRFVTEFQSDGTYTFHMAMSSDGKQWMPLMDARYHREQS